MKKLISILSIAFLCTASLSAQVILNEEFDTAPTGSGETAKFGAFDIRQYDANAVWSVTQDKNNLLSGANSAYLNISNGAAEWWALQMRFDLVTVQEADVYRITFRASSSVAVNFAFLIQDCADFREELSLPGAYDEKTFSFDSAPMDRDGNRANFMFAFGGCPPSEIWLDAVKIEKIGGNNGIDKNQSDPIKGYISGENLIIENPNEKEINVTLTDISGKTLIKTSLDKSEGSYSLSLQHGVYILSISDKNGEIISTRKLMLN